jgi:hypothetical protein
VAVLLPAEGNVLFIDLDTQKQHYAPFKFGSDNDVQFLGLVTVSRPSMRFFTFS